jgi:phage-related protein
MNIVELFVTLGFKADTMKLKEFMSAVGELNMSSVMASLGVGKLYEATNKIMNIAHDASMEIWGFSQATGISTKDTQQFSDAIEQMGGKAEGAKSSLSNLSKSLFQARRGDAGKNAALGLMGISAWEENNAVETMKKIWNYARTTNDELEQQKMIFSELGLDDATLVALKNIKDFTSALEQNRISAEAHINTMTRFHKTQSQFGQAFKLTMMDMGNILEPIFEFIERIAIAFMGLIDDFLNFREAAQGLLRDFTGGNYLKGMWDVAREGFKSGINTLGPSGHQVAASAGNVVNNMDIVISGVMHPEQAAEAVAKKISKMFSDRFVNTNPHER